MGAVRVQLVGALAVMRDGSGAEASVGSRKARVLLALLAAHRGAHVPLGQIVDALWCEQPPQRPQSSRGDSGEQAARRAWPDGRDGWTGGVPPWRRACGQR